MDDSITSPWLSFAQVVSVQALWYAIVCRFVGISTRDAARSSIVCGLVAIPFGLGFDLFIGTYGNIFRYIHFDQKAIFLVANSFFSYGLAIATVRVVPILPEPVNQCGLNSIAIIPLVCALLGILLVATQGFRAPIAMYLAGALIVVASESLLACVARRGPLMLLLLGMTAPFWRLLVLSIVTGIIYETANYSSPLWFWINGDPPSVSGSLQIVFLGYFVLLHASLSVVTIFRRLIG